MMLLVRSVPAYWQEVICISAFGLLTVGSAGNIFPEMLHLTSECCFPLYFFISDACQLNAGFTLV